MQVTHLQRKAPEMSEMQPKQPEAEELEGHTNSNLH
jgi:hypothetical protein